MNTKLSTINFGGVSCYLVQTDTTFILIDNGYPVKCKFLDEELNRAGCKNYSPALDN
ncbi:MAG: hypothetical protein ACOYXB_10730 [Bacteroidota bacterium]